MTQRHAISDTKFEFGVVGDIGRFWSASGICFVKLCLIYFVFTRCTPSC
jgi:hypothetical protein